MSKPKKLSKSEAQRRAWANMTPEARKERCRKIAEARKHQQITDETREKMAESQRQRWAAIPAKQRRAHAKPMFDALIGITRSDEWRKKAGEAKRRSWAAGKSRPHEPRICRGCDVRFQPQSGPQAYCTIECRRRNAIAAKHKISPRELQAILDAQDGVCALCGADGGGWSITGKLVVDHCHDTGRVRGFLCATCNTALGRFGDDPARLRAAADYLEHF